MNLFPPAIDNTMTKDFVSCPHLFKLSYIDRRRPAGQKIDLIAGSAFATGHEAARRAFYEEGASPQDAEAYGLGKLWQAFGDPPVPSDSPKDWQRVSLAYTHYYDAWPLGEDPVKPVTIPSGRRGIEFTFALPIEIPNPDTGQPLILAGRCDMLGLYDTLPCLEDDKLTKQLGPTWPEKWDLDNQIFTYAYAAREHGYNVQCAVIRAVKITKTTVEHAQRVKLLRNWEIDRWHAGFLHKVERMIQCYKEDIWEWNLANACTSYGGCAFRRVCMHEDEGPWLRAAEFEDNNWSPLGVTATSQVLSDVPEPAEKSEASVRAT